MTDSERRERWYTVLGWTVSLGIGIVTLIWMAFWTPHKRQPPVPARQAASAAPKQPGDAVPAAAKDQSVAAPAADDSAQAGAPSETSDVVRNIAAETAAAEPAVEIPAREEWPELGPKAPRRPFAEAAFGDADGALRGISQNQLSRWLAPVPGQNHHFSEANRASVTVAGFDGLLKLRAPWPADAVLALAPFEHHGLAIHFWNRREGVSLRYYQHPRPLWAGFRTTRKGAEPQPATSALVATDDDRYNRTFAGSVEIRHQAGTLVMNRGDLRLLTVPLEGPPTEVYFDRHAWLRTFTMYRGEPVPDDVLPHEPNTLPDAAPARLEWTRQLADGARLVEMGEGAMQLASEKGTATSWAAVKLPRPGLYEIIFRLGEMSSGTGVYLGDDTGKPLYILGILREQRTSQNVLGFVKPDAGSFAASVDLNQQPGPFVGAGQWLRLVIGSGSLKCWTSGDGAHWSRALDPLRGLRGAWSHVGLISFKTNDPRRITLEELRVCELGGISALAEANLRRQVPASLLASEGQAASWQTRVHESQPAGADPAQWRRACALSTLAAVPPANLGNLLLSELLEDNLVRPVSPAERVRAIDQAAEIYDAWDQPDSYRLSQFYERLGKRLLHEGDDEPWSKVGRALLKAPIWTTALFQTLPESLANFQLLYRVYADEWNEVRRLCRWFKLLNRPAVPDQSWPDNRQRLRLLVEWAAANAERALTDQHRTPDGRAPASFYWQHPLAVSLSKEGFNTLAELEATLSEQSYRDACQIILGVKPEVALGLLPDGRDGRLLLSLPQAVDTAMRDYPGLRQTMIEQFGTLSRLRLQQALADASPHLLQALTVQFFGTPAAAAAHQWLGDRALADGDFAQAAAEFELALLSAERDQKQPLAARLRLAGAMLGRDEGQPAKEPVAFQDMRLSAEAFEQLIAEMKKHAVAAGGAPLIAAEMAPASGVKSVRYEINGRGTLAGDVGQNPGHPNSGDVDWAARQIAGTLAGRMLYVSNRFQVTAFSLVNGKQHWSVPLGKEQADSHSWGLVSMRPLVVGDRLFVRRLAKSGPELSCFNAINGKIRWTTHSSVAVASDPLILQDRLYVFSLSTPLESGLIALELSLVNPLTGEILSQQPVIQLHNLWERQLNCQTAVVGARLVAVAGGTALCCDFSGRPLWVRRQMWIPSAQGHAANEQSGGPPLVVGQRLFVTQPGVFAVECLDLDTGRRIWQAPLPDIRRLIGITGDRLVVETARGWQAHDLETGKRLWLHDAEQILDAHVLPETGDLLLAEREPQPNDRSRPVLVWINPQTGHETARLPLDTLADRQPMLGPIIVDRDRLWTLFGRSLQDPRREMYELTPTDDPAQPPRAVRE